MRASLNLRRIGFVSGLFVLALFQNCGGTQDDTTLNSQSSFEDSLPLAYDAKIDTLAYMSCSEMQEGSYDPRAYFTFRAGAYSSATGGLGQNPTFRSLTSHYNNTDRANVLSQSNNSANTLLSLSIRNSSNMTQIWSTGDMTAGHALDAFLPELDTAEIAGPFASENVGQYINYFPGSNDQRLMEASLRFMSLEDDANKTRINLGSAYLVVGYSASGDPLDTVLRTPNDFPLPGTVAPVIPVNTQAQAFGVGLKVSFGLPSLYLSGDSRVLDPNTPLEEFDLTTGQKKPSSWDCSTNYEFMVIRPEDLGVRVSCNTIVDRPATPDETTELNAIRRVLRVEDWFVDLPHHCIVPKHTGDLCYGSTFGTRTVSYGLSRCTDTALVSCPHFVSVCIRH